MRSVILALFFFSASILSFVAMAGDTGKQREIMVAVLGGDHVYHVGQRCEATSECSAGENCKNGVCQLANGPGICLNNVDCASGETCVDGRCHK